MQIESIAIDPDPAPEMPGAQGQRSHHCFALPRREQVRSCQVRMKAGDAQALAALLPLLGCGEEAAVLGFDRLSRRSALNSAARSAMQAIAADERVHDALLRGLQAALPGPPRDGALLRAARRFHCGLQSGAVELHLARIAGLDAAVCTILSRLLRPGSAIGTNSAVAGILDHIRRDETRHVVASRSIVIAGFPTGPARAAAAKARSGLADLLAMAAPGFERLGVDPDRLCRDVRALPDGLFPR